MIFIVVKFPVKPEYADEWMTHVADFTAATRAEAGNKWFEWSRSVEDPNEYVLVEAFEDDAAEAHVNSDHFKAAMDTMQPLLTETPRIVSQSLEGKDGWDRMGELEVE
ncbi:MAG TPA: antibiotic biosynthesis monooxygenase [Corynebacterium sp.]|jgi:quinol monooxygenase YgiN|uniref:putative quinol monooxygenase n=1 Tax=Corynebacterium sp. TaxID=1720 RepID=UPI0017958318|nr:putative quinol monooxygenase [Corynebacterium sp.]MDY0113875.1 putative quinol monooxygenase [Corynebacterium sp.]HHT31275.1 antibiotic biosynthesis monooxygenase [Corynebacterium sp.]